MHLPLVRGMLEAPLRCACPLRCCCGVQILLELDAPPAIPAVSFTDGPDFSCGPVPLVPPVPGVIQKGSSSSASAEAATASV